MRTKKDLLYDLKTVDQIVKNGQRNPNEISLVLAEVLIDMRDLMVNVDKSLDSIKESLKYMEHRRTNIGPR